MTIKRHVLIRTDGTVITLLSKPSTTEVRRLIGCDMLDFVILNPRQDTIMLVDYTGMVDGKPVNEKATRRYHQICKPVTIHRIHGDVVIINDTVRE